MTTETIDDYVHEHHGRWIVARWVEADNRWYAPIRPEMRRSNPSQHTVFSRNLGELLPHAYSYQRRSAAVQRARELYGNEAEER